jgi:hypothetical protein
MSEDSTRAASAGLLSAALGGLLAFSVSCGSSKTAPNPVDTGVSSDATSDAVGDATSGDTGGGGDVATDAGDSGAPTDTTPSEGSVDDTGGGVDTTAADTSDIDAAIFDGDAACSVVDSPVITSTVSDPGMTLDDFSAMCAALSGFVEIHPECGGHVTCKGLSYDQLTGLLTSHTCAGLNSCQGFSCILP